MTPLTAFDYPGNVMLTNGEISSKYVHSYDTARMPKIAGSYIEDMLEEINGVSEFEVTALSQATYHVEVHVEEESVLRRDKYMKLLDDTTAWNI